MLHTSALQQQTVNFNKNLVISNNGGNLSNDAGLILVPNCQINSSSWRATL
ncbi:hypothetical protein FD11_GL000388 [Ligilactobacillus pobuzihii E100301 = KCTC 13174]|nr:hypothetical protein FD11_GL000388 [Ligilactobacillus pobuzihii E100301 = KCTC 13174]